MRWTDGRAGPRPRGERRLPTSSRRSRRPILCQPPLRRPRPSTTTGQIETRSSRTLSRTTATRLATTSWTCRRRSAPRSSVPLPSTSFRSPRLPTFTPALPCTARASRKRIRSTPRSSATSAPWLFVRPRCPMWTRPQHPQPSTRLDGSKASSRPTRNGRIAGSPGLAGARQRRSAGSGARSEPRAQTDPSSEVDRSTRSTSAQPLQSSRLFRCDA